MKCSCKSNLDASLCILNVPYLVDIRLFISQNGFSHKLYLINPNRVSNGCNIDTSSFPPIRTDKYNASNTINNETNRKTTSTLYGYYRAQLLHWAVRSVQVHVQSSQYYILDHNICIIVNVVVQYFFSSKSANDSKAPRLTLL